MAAQVVAEVSCRTAIVAALPAPTKHRTHRCEEADVGETKAALQRSVWRGQMAPATRKQKPKAIAQLSMSRPALTSERERKTVTKKKRTRKTKAAAPAAVAPSPKKRRPWQWHP